MNGEAPVDEPRAEWELALEGETVEAGTEPASVEARDSAPQTRDRDRQSGDRQGSDRQGSDRQGSDRQGGDAQGQGEPGNRRRRRRGRDRDRQGGDRQGSDRQGSDRQGNDRQGNDRQGGDRQGNDRQGGERQGEEEPWQGEPVDVEGLLDLRDEGYGFLRVSGYLPSKDDVYVSVKQVRQFGLRKGDHVTGASRPAGRNEKNPALLRIDLVNGVDPEQARDRGPGSRTSLRCSRTRSCGSRCRPIRPT